MDFHWQDVDPDLRLFIVVGVPLIAIGLYLKSCGFLGPEPVPDWSMPAGMEKHSPGPSKSVRLHDETEPPTLANIGITKKQSHRWQTAATEDQGQAN